MPSEKQFEERIENINSIINHIRLNGAKSRRELSCDLGLSWGCVSELSQILIKKNIVTEEEPNNIKSKGRTPSLLVLNPDICFLGIDINIRGLSACLCNLLGEKLESFSEKIDCSSKEGFIKSVKDFADSIICNKTNIFGIGFAMQGIFSPESNCWKFPSKNISINFSTDFIKDFNIPITVEHDPNCILYGCFNDTEKSKMIVRIDNGIGASIHKKGEFVNELLELGYFVVGSDNKRLHETLSLSKAQSFASKKDLEEYLKSGGERLGTALGNVCNLFRLDKIYLCGDMITNYNLLNEAFFSSYKNTAIAAAEIITVEVTDAAYGAAKIAIDNFKYYFKEN